MPTLNGRNFTGVVGLNLREANGCIRFETPKITPTTTSGERVLWVNSSNQLIFDSGATSLNISTISAGGGGADWDAIYANDKTLTIDSTTLTFALTHATNDGLTITGSAGSSGDCIQITNSGSGNDIEGTSGLWAVSAAGAATLVSIAGCDSLTAAANLVLEANGTGTISIGATSTGAIDIGTGTGAITLASAVTASLGITITAGGLLSSDGLVDIVDNANDASTLRVTNDTQSTYGNASDAGMVVFRSESLTTGALLHLSVDETGMAGGFFLRCWSQDAGAAAFTVGELGVTVIAGSASGTASLTQTKGDHTISDGQLSVTRAGDDAVTLTVTNNTAATASSVVIAGSGTFTGTTTTSFMTVTPSGLTTGTGIYVVGAALTEGKLMHLATDATMTSGSVLYVSSIGDNSANTSGELATFVHTSDNINATVNKIGNIVSIASTRTVHGASGAVADDYDCLSVTKTVDRDTSGTFTSAGACIYIENVVGTGTVTDTSKGLEIVMDSGGTGSGLALTHNAVTATAASITSVATSGIGLLVTQGTGVMTTGSVVRINSSGVSTGTGQGTLLDLVSSGAQAAVVCSLVTAALTTGTMFVMTANNLTTTGVGLSIGSTGTGMTTGSLLRITSGTTGQIGTNGVVSFVASGNHTTTGGVGFVHVSDASAAGTVMSIYDAAVTSGVLLSVNDGAATTLTTGSLIRAATATTGALNTNGVVSITASGVYTSTAASGALLYVSAAATTAGYVASVNATALTTGYALFVAGAAAYTGTGFITVSATAATSGTIENILATGLTTGTAIKCSDNTAITTGSLLDLRVNSADNSASSIVYIEQTHASAAARVPLKMKQVAPTSTNYYKAQQVVTAAGTWTLWVGNGTNSPNGSLSGTAGDICVNCDSGKSYYCTGTTNWTAQ